MYRSPWTAIAEATQGIGNSLLQGAQFFGQKAAAQGQQIKAQVQDQVSQMEGFLADPNYQWDDAKRQAAEAFVTQGKTLLTMDDTQVPGSYAEWQERGIKIPTQVSAGRQGESANATRTELRPAEGGIAGFLGDVNQGVTQAGQKREQYEKDLEMARELAINGQQQAFTMKRDEMLNNYGIDNTQLQHDLGIQATQMQLDVQGSATAADRIIATLAGIGSLSDPKNKQQADTIMEQVRGMGLQPYDLAAVEATYQGLGSGSAELGWKERLTQVGLSEQQLALGEQQITLGDQQIQLGEYMLTEQEYLANRRSIEDFYEDHAGMKTIIAEAVANGDDKYINDIMNTLQGGGSINPDMYKALTAAGITPENIAGQVEGATRNAAWVERKDALDVAETNAAYQKLITGQAMDDLELANARNVYADGISKQYTVSEIDGLLQDPRSTLSRLVATGDVTSADIKSMKRNAGVYQVIRQDEVNAPKIERQMTMLETLAAVPADPATARNALTGTLSELQTLGVVNEEQAAGITSAYERAWEYGRSVEDEELAGKEASRAYTQALMQVQTASLTAVAADTGWSDEAKEMLAGVQTAFDSTREDIETQYPQCFFRDEMGMNTGGPECARAYELVEENRLQREQSVAQFLGALTPQDTQNALLSARTDIDNNVRNDPAFAGASETQIVEEINRRSVDNGYGPLPTAVFDRAAQVDAQASAPQARQGRPSTGSLFGDIGAAGRELGGTVRQQIGEIIGGANAVGNYVLGGNRAQAQGAPATPPARTQPTVGRTPQAPPPALQSNPRFGQLVQGIKDGTLQPSGMRSIASYIAQDPSLNMTVAEVVEWAEAMTRNGSETDGFVHPANRSR